MCPTIEILGKERRKEILGKERKKEILGKERRKEILGKERRKEILGKERRKEILGKERAIYVSRLVNSTWIMNLYSHIRSHLQVLENHYLPTLICVICIYRFTVFTKNLLECYLVY